MKFPFLIISKFYIITSWVVILLPANNLKGNKAMDRIALDHRKVITKNKSMMTMIITMVLNMVKKIKDKLEDQGVAITVVGE